jgi:radical SAM protein with 4Fe4S-binding SPASM domain
VKNKLITAYAFSRYITLGKIWNYGLLYISFVCSRILKKPIIWGLPTTLSIEPTTSCNLRCPECPSGLRKFSRPTGMLQQDLFAKIIEETKKNLTYLHLYFQGEPFLHPGFFDLVAKADSAGIFTSTSTNAHYLTKENVDKTIASGLKQLIVSMDGITQEVYQDYRIGGNLNKVQTGISKLLTARKEKKTLFPRVVLQFLVTGQNEHQIAELKQWAANLNVDELQLKTTQIYDYENGSALIPKDLTYSRYIPDLNGKWKLKKETTNKCWRMWQGAVATWDGRVVPCCFDKDGKYVMGHMSDASIQQIWRNEKYGKFRLQLLSDRKQIDICKNCSE